MVVGVVGVVVVMVVGVVGVVVGVVVVGVVNICATARGANANAVRQRLSKVTRAHVNILNYPL